MFIFELFNNLIFLKLNISIHNINFHIYLLKDLNYE